MCRNKDCRNLPKGSADVLKKEKYLLCLKASEEIVTADAEYQFDEDKDLSKVKLIVDENIIEISGDCTESVFRKLSQKISNRYEIHSCYTCRYGNFCPYGDKDNEIFCINDFEPKCKEEVLFIFQDEEEMKKRKRTLFDICSGFKHCSDDYWYYK